MGKWSFLSALVATIVSCTSVTLPIQEYTLARSAMASAEEFEAERLAPSSFQQAHELYKKAEQLYGDREFEESRVLFIKARKLAEKAETTARLKKAKSGEVLK